MGHWSGIVTRTPRGARCSPTYPAVAILLRKSLGLYRNIDPNVQRKPAGFVLRGLLLPPKGSRTRRGRLPPPIMCVPAIFYCRAYVLIFVRRNRTLLIIATVAFQTDIAVAAPTSTRPIFWP